MISLNWPLVLVTTVALYGLIIITLPFNAVYATLFLFTLIAYWSRFPGVGIPAPFWILYTTDLVDIFSVIISINLGGPIGALFSLFCNLHSRLSGTVTPWNGVISDSFAQGLACLALPLAHSMIGGNILITVILYSILRGIFLIPLDQIFYRVPLPQYLTEMVVGVGALLLVNVVYAQLFGKYLDALLEEGVKFSWVLFIIATVLIIIFYITVFGINKSSAKNKKSAKKIINKVIHKKAFSKKNKEKNEGNEFNEMEKIKNNI